MTELASLITRRQFLAAAAALAYAACRNSSPAPAADAVLRSRPGAPTGTVQPGLHPLGLSSGARDGFLYVPPSYRAETPAPLIVLLHGAGHDANEWASAPLDDLLGGRGAVALIPSSRGSSWDVRFGGFGPDVRFLDSALAQTFGRVNVDPARIALAGFSDGASYALSLGASNGDLFGALMAFSPGFFAPAARTGTPKVYVSHGTSDQVLPIDATSRQLVPRLRELGYDVTYREFAGGHTVTLEIGKEAIGWWLGGT